MYVGLVRAAPAARARALPPAARVPVVRDPVGPVGLAIVVKLLSLNPIIRIYNTLICFIGFRNCISLVGPVCVMYLWLSMYSDICR